MERATAADASFLYMENPVVHMHVTGVLVLDPSTVPGGYSFDAFRTHVLRRLHRIPPFRRRLIRVPFGIDHPVWVEDPEFEIDDHLHRVVLDAPGDMSQLEDFVGEYAAIPLDQNRPLWDMTVVEGLRGGAVATVSKVHHIAVDGVSGTDLMAQIVDLTPVAEDADQPIPRFRPEPIPSRVGVAVEALASRVSDPLRALRAFARSAGSVGRVAATLIDGNNSGPSMARPFDAPRTLFNQTLTSRRSVAFSKTPLDDLKQIKSTFGTTVNDVFLAACTQSLRGYLNRRGEVFDRPLVVSVPVSVRGKVTDGQAANQVSNMFVRLPVHVADPVEQLRAIRADTRDAKAVHGAIGADVIGDVTELTPPAIFNLASRMYSRAGLADRLPAIHNLVISNVPGPPFPLYVAGARLEGVYPFGPLIEGSGLNITVLSNMGNMDIGVIGCPDIAPDVSEVADGIVTGVEVLREAAAHEAVAKAALDEIVAETLATKPPARVVHAGFPRSRRRNPVVDGVAADDSSVTSTGTAKRDKSPKQRASTKPSAADDAAADDAANDAAANDTAANDAVAGKPAAKRSAATNSTTKRSTARKPAAKKTAKQKPASKPAGKTTGKTTGKSSGKAAKDRSTS